jgi:hypothetical protein
MRIPALAMITALSTAALLGPANAQSSSRPPVYPPPVNEPAQEPGGLTCPTGHVWLPAYWDRLNEYHQGRCVTNQEYQHLYTHIHS